MTALHGSYTGIADVVRARAERSPEAASFTGVTFAGRGNRRTERLMTVGELDSLASAVARQILDSARPGDRALLQYRHGIDFVVGFLACLYAGVVAVPAPMPRQGLGRDRLRSIVSSARPMIVLAGSSPGEELDDLFDDGVRILRTDLVEPGERMPLASTRGGEGIALLQYSSGTTGDAKGVAITHANLLHQARVICAAVEPAPEDVAVSWLPMYHDMGLVTGVVMPMYVGLHCWLMSPDAYVTRPLRWMQCISDARAAYCMAPDFAYAHCASRIDDSDVRTLDLSSLRYAVSGAEPVRESTIDDFSRRFAPAGFRREAFYPAYGLAEGTLLVAGASGVRLRHMETSATALEKSPPAVSCGRPILDMQVAIVDPEIGTRCADGVEGEIWVQGGSVAKGYWSAEELSVATFSAYASDGSGPWLRTGDMGLVEDGELYVRGRLKDLIKVRGQGVHPEDIEAALARSHPALTGAIAAFSVDDGRAERVVVVQEIGRGATRKISPEDALQALLACSARSGLIPVDEIVLVDRALPRTTSGKVRRSELRQRHSAGQPGAVLVWRRGAEPGVRNDVAHHLHWIGDYLEEVLGRRPSPREEFRSMGLGTEAHRGLIHRLQTLVGVQALHSELMQFGSAQELAMHLAARYGRGEAPGSGDSAGRPAEALRSEAPATQDEPVAIIGVACRFPGADSAEAFWENICAGHDAVSEVPAERWSTDMLFDPNPLSKGKMSTRYGGFIEGIDLFDRKFFGMSARESASTDPAHRLMMELGWEVLEDAGIPAGTLDGSRTGVYVGISGCDYSHLQFGDDATADAYAGLGCALTNAASRVSYMLNLRGPALAIDAACSSSLGALHVAVGAIRNGEVDLALAGGVNIILAPSVTMSLSKAGMMAPDGRCKAFDERANGYVRAEGAGFVLLKPLSRALADGDRVYAVVRATASNQDGRSSSLSAPNGEAQQRVVMEACRRAGIVPTEYTYVEAHGTGTPIGDPIEVNALGEVFRASGKPAFPVLVGSVKTNIGHAESAAGIASIIKTSLALYHRLIPGNLHFKTPNPLIRFDDFDIEVPGRTTAIPESVTRPLAGVNGFGIGGTNVHAVLQGMEPRAREADRATSRLGDWTLPVTARTEEALKNNLQALADWLESNPTADPRDVVATLVLRRDLQPRRAMVCGSDRASAVRAMRSYVEGTHAPQVVVGQVTGDPPRVAFVFSGQGAQWWGMGRGLYASEPSFRADIDRCASHLDPLTGWSLVEALHADEEHSPLSHTQYAQPSLFAIQYALGRYLQELGLVPDAVLGHSLGEIAAAEAAGLLTLQDACQLVSARGKLMQEITGQGLMASVELPVAELAREIEHYEGRLSIAASNGPSTSVLSGDAAALVDVLERLADRNVASVQLDVDYAFHSAQTDPLVPRLLLASEGIGSGSAVRDFYSSVDACRLDCLDADYWARNMRQQVCFREALEAMARDGVTVFVEISPHAVLSGAINRTLAHGSFPGAVIPTLQRNVPDDASVLHALANSFVCGGHDWKTLIASDAFLADLPRYRWDRQRYWLDGQHRQFRDRYSSHLLFGHRVPGAQFVWEAHPDPNMHPWLDGARLGGQAFLPLAACIELAVEAARCAMSPSGIAALRSVRVHSAGGERPDALLQVAIHSGANNDRRVVLNQHADASAGKLAGWVPVFDAVIEVREGASNDPLGLGRYAIERVGDEAGRREAYRLLSDAGLDCAPSRQAIARGWRVNQGVVVELDETLVGASQGFNVPYAVVDAVEQTARLAAGAHVALRPESIGALHLGAGLERARFVSCRARPGRTDDGHWHVDAWVVDEDERVLAIFDSISLVPAEHVEGARISPHADDWRCEVVWNEVPLAGESGPASRALVLVSDAGGAGNALHGRLLAMGVRVALVDPLLPCLDAPEAGVASFEAAVKSAMDTIVAAGDEVAGFVDLSPLDFRNAEQLSGSPPDTCELAQVYRTLQLVQAAAAIDQRAVPRIWTISRNARAVVDGDPCDSPLGAMVWGASRSISIEHREMRCTCVDVDDPFAQMQSLVTELLADGPADQLAYRGARRYVASLRYRRDAPSQVDSRSGGRSAYILQPRPDSTWNRQSIHRPWPQAGELLVRLEHADIDLTPRHGAEGRDAQLRMGVGEVECAGAGGEEFEPGMRVAFLTTGSVCTHTLVASELAVPLPGGADAALVAGLFPVIEAVFALRGQAGSPRGRSVLIRDMDGRGLAAVAAARYLGMRVYAIVAPGLRDAYSACRPAGLFDAYAPGVDHILREATHGGVDMLLDVSGGWMPQGPRAVRDFGRIVMLTSRPPSHFEPPANISVERIDIGAALGAAPSLAQAVLSELVGSIAQGGLQRSLPDSLAGSAIAIPEHAELRTPASGLRDDGSYLVTGGLGGLGLEIAERLARAGARHLVLAARSAPNLRALDRIAAVERHGAQVHVASVDVASAASITSLLDRFGGDLPPLRGIVHAAGVLANRLSMQMSFEEFLQVMPSKVAGACHLEGHPAVSAVDFHISFSSLASMLGSPGQANYAAANAFLETLAAYRHARGRAGLAIAWGPWSEVGMAANEHNLARLGDHGIGVVELRSGLDLLEAFVNERASSVVGVLPMDWETWARGRQQLASTPYFSAVVPESACAAPTGRRLGAADLEGLEVEAQLALIQEAIVTAVASTLRMEPASIEIDVPLASLGLDSIVALELKERVESQLDIVVRTSSLIGGQSIAAMAKEFRKDFLDGRAKVESTAPAPLPEDVPDAVSEMTREEIEAMLRELDLDDAEVD